MQRLNSVNPTDATGRAKELLDATKSKMGMVPNLMRTLASSPAALEAYLNVSGALGHGSLPAKLREQLAVFTAETNGCVYCASAHTAIGKHIGLGEQELLHARECGSEDPKVEAALKFTRAVLQTQGKVSDADLQSVRDAGYTDGDIAEMVAHVAMNVFSNYFNNVANTEVDFPKVALLKG